MDVITGNVAERQETEAKVGTRHENNKNWQYLHVEHPQLHH